MMAKNNLKRGLLSLACLGLAACGGGGGDSGPDDGSVPLSSESDVLRELSLLSSAVNAIDTVSGAVGDSSFAASAAAQSGAASKALVIPAADSGSPCDSGSDTRTGGAKTYSFTYFSSPAAPVAYQVNTFAACKRSQSSDTGASYQVTLDGVAEAGATPVAVGGADYRYLIAGTGSTPLQAVIDGGGVKLTLKIAGTEQAKSTDSLATIGSIITIDYSGNLLGGTISGNLALGSGSTPFYIGTSKVSTAYSLDGPYAYHTNKCDGGTATADTTTDLTTASDDAGSYINGGTLKLSTTSAAVTVVFNGDGSASYTFQNGSSGTLTRDELDAAIEDSSCGF
jgi:hypothetical protein